MYHQKSYRAVGSPRGQELLVALSAGAIGVGDGRAITSSCHDKLPTVIGINPEDWKREEHPPPLDSSQHRLLTPVQER